MFISRKNLKGFTLIELLVVIAIIGILATVVIGSVSTARAKARVASAIATMRSVRSGFEITNDNTGSYATACADTGFVTALTAASKAVGGNATAAVATVITSSTGVGTVYCSSAATTYVVAIVTETNKMYCFDSSGRASKDIPASISAAATVCP